MLITFALCCVVYLTSYCTIITHLYTVLTGALLWSTEKLQTIQVSGSFSFKADIFRMAERYKTSRWEAGHTLCGRSTNIFKVWTPFLVFFLAAPPTPVFLGFPDSSVGKESGCNVGGLGWIPGLGRPPEEGKGYLLQYSGLENSMDCIVHGVTESRPRLSTFPFHTACSILVHQRGIKPAPPSVEEWSFNHWTVKGSPKTLNYFLFTFNMELTKKQM